MIFFLWIRGFVAHSVVEKDSLFLEALNCIRKGDFDKARHDFLSERIFHDPLLGENLRKRVVKNNIDRWRQFLGPNWRYLLISWSLGGALKKMSKNFSSLILMKLCHHVGIWFIRVCFKFGSKIPSGSAWLVVKTVLLIIPWARKGILWVFHVFRGISQVIKRI